jgi:hypothetical protein
MKESNSSLHLPVNAFITLDLPAIFSFTIAGFFDILQPCAV